MTIPASPNSVSLYQIKDEADNSAQDSSVSTASAMSLNDSDVRGLISKSSGATMSFSEWRGVSGASLNAWASSGISTAPDPWGSASYTNATFAQVGCNYAQKVDTTNDRLEHRFATYNSGSALSYAYAYQSYTGLDSATFEGKAVYSVSASSTGSPGGSVDNPESYSPSSNSWTTVSTSTYSPVWQWEATVNSGSGTRSLSGTVTFYVRASLSGTYYPSSSGYNSGTKYISLSATRGLAGPGGPGDPP